MKVLFVVLGPTAVGKTEVCMKIAQRLHTPVINADSRQIFSGIPIATAAPTYEQLLLVKHYFVGTCQLSDYYSASKYEEEVMALLAPDGELGKLPFALMSGGSMMYIDAVCNGIDDIPTIDEDTRAMMKHRLDEVGLEQLVAELRLLDPEYYAIVDRKNVRRVVHALEICYMTGKTYTSFRKNKKKQRDFRIVKIGLNRQREELYQRINQRVTDMVAKGLVEEAQRVSIPWAYARCSTTLKDVAVSMRPLPASKAILGDIAGNNLLGLRKTKISIGSTPTIWRESCV